MAFWKNKSEYGSGNAVAQCCHAACARQRAFALTRCRQTCAHARTHTHTHTHTHTRTHTLTHLVKQDHRDRRCCEHRKPEGPLYGRHGWRLHKARARHRRVHSSRRLTGDPRAFASCRGNRTGVRPRPRARTHNIHSTHTLSMRTHAHAAAVSPSEARAPCHGAAPERKRRCISNSSRHHPRTLFQPCSNLKLPVTSRVQGVDCDPLAPQATHDSERR